MRKVLMLSLVALLATAAIAQQPSSFALRAHVPFEFVIHGDTMPAGDYTVQPTGPTPSPLIIRQNAGSKSEYVFQLPGAEKWSGRPQLVFHRLGDIYFLTEIRDPQVGVQRVVAGERYQNARKQASVEKVVVAAK